MAFKRLVERFVTNGMVQPANPLGRPPITEETITSFEGSLEKILRGLEQ